MNEEAGFIAALLAEPDDRVVLLVYADWLDERNDPRAKYLRLLATENAHPDRLRQLRSGLDTQWVEVIASRGFEVGCTATILTGPFSHSNGTVTEIAADRSNAVVRILLWGRPVPIHVPFTSIERVEGSASI